jgi:anti-sigma factor RsiW
MREIGKNPDHSIDCRECVDNLQEYLDGTLDKQHSLQFFLHLRDCSECQEEHDQLTGLFHLLDSLPEQEIPADFDDAILASVPYDAYKAMEPIRRQRVPVFLEDTFLPAMIRSRVTRIAGLGVSAVCAGLSLAGNGPQLLPLVAVLGVVPELLVRLQGVGRWAVLAGNKSES